MKPIIPYGKSTETTQSKLFDAGPGPRSGLDIDTSVGNEDKVSRGQRVRTAPDRLQVTGRGRSYESHQVQSVCLTSLTQVLGGGGGIKVIGLGLSRHGVAQNLSTSRKEDSDRLWN